ncbi:MAG: efflux RND transporter periplasmic adaptor subunit [Planctomycetota bacterium]
MAFAVSVRGHEGHGGAEIGPYDLDTPRQVSPETAAHIGLKTAEVDFGMVEDVLGLSGIVRASPDRHWTIATRTAGKVLSVRVQVGDRVKQGDLLLEIDSPELARNIYEVRKLETEYQKLLVEIIRSEGRVEQLRIEVRNAQKTAELVEAELQRSEAAGDVIPLNMLGEQRVAALKARGEAELKSVDLTVAVKETEALKNQAEALRLSRHALSAIANVEPSQQAAVTQPTDDQPINLVRLLSPADGVVVERKARTGHWAVAGETLLAVADYSVVQIEGELPESLIPRVVSRSSDKVRVKVPADSNYLSEGRIKFISPVLDEIKRTAHVLIEASNTDGSLRDAMFVDLAIVLREEKTAVVVARSSVIQDGPVHFVFVKSGDNVYQKQDIEPGLSNDQLVEVLSGLAPGDVVVTQGAYSLTQLRPKAGTAVASSAPTQIKNGVTKTP